MPLLIFDADGTLFDTNYQFTEAYWEAFKRCGKSVPRALIHYHVGMGHDQALPRVTSPRWAKRYGAHCIRLANQIYHRKYFQRTQPLPYAEQVLRGFKRAGFTLALASSSPRNIVDRYVTLLGGKRLFTVVSSFDDVTQSKPHPELFLNILQDVKISPRNACVIGDSIWDMQAAKRAQIPAVGVLTGGYWPEELRKHGAREVYQDVAELFANRRHSRILAR